MSKPIDNPKIPTDRLSPSNPQKSYGVFTHTPNFAPTEKHFTFRDSNKNEVDMQQIQGIIANPYNSDNRAENIYDLEPRRDFLTFGGPLNQGDRPISNEHLNLIKKNKIDDDNVKIDNNVNTPNNILGFSTDVKNLGEEKIIQLDKQPDTKPRAPFNRVVYIFFQYYWALCMYILLSAMIIRYYKSSINNFKDLALALLIAHGVKILINFICYMITRNKDSDMNMVYFWNSLSSFSFVILYLGGFLFFKGTVPRLYYFSIHHIVIHFVIWVGSGKAAKIYVAQRSNNFFESIQILFICIKLGNPDSLQKWNTTTYYYFIIFIGGLVMGGICGIVAIVMGTLGIFKRGLNTNTRIMFFIFFAVCATLCWIAILNFLIFLGFRNLLNDGVVSPLKISYNNLDSLLYNSSLALLILSGIYVLIMSLAWILLRNFIRQNYSNDQIQRLGIVSFAKEMQLGIKKTSDTYYQADNLQGNETQGPVELDNNQKQECILCYSNPNEIIIKPCGHSGYCKNCMMNYLKTKNICPMCKLPIDTLLLFYYDEERQGYFSREAIRVANVKKIK